MEPWPIFTTGTMWPYYFKVSAKSLFSLSYLSLTFSTILVLGSIQTQQVQVHNEYLKSVRHEVERNSRQTRQKSQLSTQEEDKGRHGNKSEHDP